jgi:hypothetical protein
MALNYLSNFNYEICSACGYVSIIDLELEKCLIGNEGMKHLTKGYWPRLRILNLGKR